MCFQWGFVKGSNTAGAQQINFNVQFTQVYQVTANYLSDVRTSLSGTTTAKEYVNACARTLYELTNSYFKITYTYAPGTTNAGTTYIAVGKL